MSKFDYELFFGGYDSLAVSKERYSREQAIEIAKTELALCEKDREKKPYIAIGNGFVRHRAGVDEDHEPCVGWWLEYEEHERSCPVWVFHNAKTTDELFKNYEYIKTVSKTVI
jgi:hypothetical protein